MSLILDALKKTVDAKRQSEMPAPARQDEVLLVERSRGWSPAITTAILSALILLGVSIWMAWRVTGGRQETRNVTAMTGALEARLELQRTELEKEIAALSAQIKELKSFRDQLKSENQAFRDQVQADLSFQSKNFKTLVKNQQALSERFERLKKQTAE